MVLQLLMNAVFVMEMVQLAKKIQYRYFIEVMLILQVSNLM